MSDLLTRPTLCVWFEVRWRFDWRLRCAVVYPISRTCLTTGLVTNFRRNTTKGSFPSNSFQFIILSRYYDFHITWHWGSLPGLIPLLIPWYQITHPSLPFSFQYLTPFDACYAAYTNCRFACSSVSKKLGFFLCPGWELIRDLFDQYRYLKQPKKICDGDGF